MNCVKLCSLLTFCVHVLSNFVLLQTMIGLSLTCMVVITLLIRKLGEGQGTNRGGDGHFLNPYTVCLD